MTAVLTELERREREIGATIAERNERHFDERVAALDGWAADLKVGLERDIKELDRQIQDAKRESRTVQTLEAKVAVQRQVRALEQERTRKRRTLFEAQDAIDARREALIEETAAKLGQRVTRSTLMTLRWRMR